MKKNAEKIRKLGLFLTVCVSTAVMVGCGKGQEAEETEKLTVCTDEIHRDTVEALAEDWKKMNHGSDVEIISIPQDDSLAESKIIELRTEIMSGGADRMFLSWRAISTQMMATRRHYFLTLKKQCTPISFYR